MNLGGRLKQERDKKGWTQEKLAQEASKHQGARIDQGNIATTEKRDSRNSKYASAFAAALNIDLEWLLTGHGNVEPDFRPVVIDDGARDDRVYIPELDLNASCGDGNLSFMDIPEQKMRSYKPKAISDKGWKVEDLFTIKAQGNSMESKISDGDSVTINTSFTSIYTGKIYLVCWLDSYYLKYVERVDAETIHLISENKDYPPKVINEKNGTSFRVLGMAVDRSGWL